MLSVSVSVFTRDAELNTVSLKLSKYKDREQALVLLRVEDKQRRCQWHVCDLLAQICVRPSILHLPIHAYISQTTHPITYMHYDLRMGLEMNFSIQQIHFFSL